MVKEKRTTTPYIDGSPHFGTEGDDLSRLIHLRHRMGKLEHLGEPKTFPKNHILIRSGTVPRSCYLVKSGQVVATPETSAGEELIFYIMETQALFGEVNALFHRISPVTFKTTMPTTLICIGREALQAAVKDDNQLLMDLMESVSDKFFVAMEELHNIKCHNATWLVCDLLLVFASRYGVSYDNKVLIQKKISIQLMTSMLGINRATTVRSLKALKDLNLLETVNGYYCIRSIEMMRQHQEMIGST